MAQVELTSDAKEDLRDLDRSAQILVLKALKKLEDHPEQRGAPLGSNVKGNLTGFRKLVVGDRDYRIVYRIESTGDVTVVWVIAKRADEEVYRLAVARVQLAANLDEQLSADLTSILADVWDK